MNRRSRNNFPSTKKRVNGFTLPEMLIAMMIASLMVMTMAQSLAPALDFYAKQETEARLKDLRESIKGAYRAEYSLIDATDEKEFRVSRGAVLPVLPVNGICPSDANTFAALGAYLANSASLAWRDGHGQGLCIDVTSRLTASVQGVEFVYRSIAVASPGADGVLEPGTTFDANGFLTLAGDDKGFLIDGREVVGSMVSVTNERIERVQQVLSTYFMTRYRSNPSRDIAVNYFSNTDPNGNASPSYDALGFIASTRSLRIALADPAYAIMVSQLGLSASDVVDAWGNSLYFDNSSANVRHPNNAVSHMRLPPYTSRVSAQLPNGTFVEKTVVGYY